MRGLSDFWLANPTRLTPGLVGIRSAIADRRNLVVYMTTIDPALE